MKRSDLVKKIYSLECDIDDALSELSPKLSFLFHEFNLANDELDMLDYERDKKDLFWRRLLYGIVLFLFLACVVLTIMESL